MFSELECYIIVYEPTIKTKATGRSLQKEPGSTPGRFLLSSDTPNIASEAGLGLVTPLEDSHIECLLCYDSDSEILFENV